MEYTAFHGLRRVASGSATNLVEFLKDKPQGEVVVFDDLTGSQIDLDYRGKPAEVAHVPAEIAAEPRGRGVVHDAALRKLKLRRGDPTADALLRLLARAVGQADDRERGLSVRQMSLDLDAARLEPDESVGGCATEHPSNVDREFPRMCAEIALEGALEPLQLSRVHADDVERSVEATMLRVLGEPDRRRVAQPPLLLPVDEFDRIAEIDPRSHLDLAEDQVRPATHDQVDFASSDAGAALPGLIVDPAASPLQGQRSVDAVSLERAELRMLQPRSRIHAQHDVCRDGRNGEEESHRRYEDDAVLRSREECRDTFDHRRRTEDEQ